MLNTVHLWHSVLLDPWGTSLRYLSVSEIRCSILYRPYSSLSNIFTRSDYVEAIVPCSPYEGRHDYRCTIDTSF